MVSLDGKIAVVTGASRGVGKGVALGLGEAGATVYVTGRTMDYDEAKVPIPTSLLATAEEVEDLGGRCIPVRVDHRKDADVDALFRRVRDEEGQLDILVNSAWAGYENIHRMEGPKDYIFELPFWEMPLSVFDDMFWVGVRSTYVASMLAVPLMIDTGGGLIAHISSFAGPVYMYNVAYGVSKTAVDRMASDMAIELREEGIASVSMYPGLVRTEAIMRNAEFFDLSDSESPQFTGRAVAHLAGDPDVMARTGRVQVVADLALEYGFTDVDGKQPRSLANDPSRAKA